MFRIFSLIFYLLLAVNQANAEIFKCVAADGTVAFQEKPCDGAGAETKVEIKDRSINGRTSETTGAGCSRDIAGLWKQTHISMELDKDLMADASQKWLFKSNKRVTHYSFIEQEIPYECTGDIITLHALIKSDLRILRHEGNKMVWESVDFGGYIYVSR